MSCQRKAVLVWKLAQVDKCLGEGADEHLQLLSLTTAYLESARVPMVV